MHNLWNDVRYSLRLLAKTPGFTAAAVLLLGLGLGINVTVFTALNAVLIRPMPGISDPDTLLFIGRIERGQDFDNSSYPDFRSYRDGNNTLSGLAAFDDRPFTLSSENNTERLRGQLVSANYFAVAGVKPAAGRFPLPSEDKPGSEAVAIISHNLWMRRWAGDRSVIGKQVVVNGKPSTITGVAAPGFRGVSLPGGVDIWAPIEHYASAGMLEARDGSMLMMIGRLRPGVRLGQAQANVAAIARQLQSDYPKDNGNKLHQVAGYHPLAHPGVKSEALTFLGILTAVTFIGLIVICANVANLMLARASTRSREVAVRQALGASRFRLMRQILVEGLLVSLAGAGTGVLISQYGVEMLMSYLPSAEISMDAMDLSAGGAVLGYAAAMALICTIAFALAPAWQISKSKVWATMRAGELSSAPDRSRLRSALTVAQVALCAVLLAGAGLVFRSLQQLQSIDPRFQADNLLLVSFDAELNGHDQRAAQQMQAQILERAAAIPGVKDATLARQIPFTHSGLGLGPMHGGVVDQQHSMGSDCNVVGPHYFRTMGIGLLAGRDILPSDTPTSQRVVVINETLARRFWPNQDPIGQYLYIDDGDGRGWQVVGLTGDSRYRDATEPARTFFYVPLTQRSMNDVTLHVRSGVDPASLMPLVRKEVAAVDPYLPLYNVRTMRGIIQESFWPQRLATSIIGLSSLMTMLLAGIGLYAVKSLQVQQRRREIGIRMAIGAAAGLIQAGILREGMKLAAIGLVIGIALATAGTQVLSSLLYGVTPADPLTFLAVIVLLLAVMLLASYIPARQATRVDPMVALRYE